MPHDVTLQKFPLKSGTVKQAYDRKDWVRLFRKCQQHN